MRISQYGIYLIKCIGVTMDEPMDVNAYAIPESMCLICEVNFDAGVEKGKRVKATSKGVTSLKQYSALRNDERLVQFLASNPVNVYYHSECHKGYTNQRLFEQQKRQSAVEAETVVPQKSLRSSSTGFLWKEHCFLCASPVTFDTRYSGSKDTQFVRMLHVRDSIMNMCERRSDDWSQKILGRLQSCNCLVAEEAVYHKQCYCNFMTGRRNPKDPNYPDQNTRPVFDQKMTAFDTLCVWLESSSDLHSISELHEVMTELAGHGDEVYSEKHMQRLLLERYKGQIVLSQEPGRNNIVCFQNTASRILSDKWYTERQDDEAKESLRVVYAAAKLIQAEIRDKQYNCTEYPETATFKDIKSAKAWIPPLLMKFLEIIVANELKQVALGHSIVQAARPKSSISPVLFAAGISLDHAHGSRLLLDMLSRLGFSISYDEVNRYKQSAVQCDGEAHLVSSPFCFTQWSADNMDHNINTIDGLNSFHGMGIVSMSTPYDRGLSGKFTETAVPRLARLNVADVVKNRGIPLLSYSLPEQSALSTLKFESIETLKFSSSSGAPLLYDLAWQFGRYVCDADRPCPNWSGFMQHVTVSNTDYFPSSDILMLPVIDLNPNDVSCIYSTLVFIEKQAALLNMETACVTFESNPALQ